MQPPRKLAECQAVSHPSIVVSGEVKVQQKAAHWGEAPEKCSLFPHCSEYMFWLGCAPSAFTTAFSHIAALSELTQGQPCLSSSFYYLLLFLV